MQIELDELESTAARIHRYLDATPVLRLDGGSTYLKLENEQPTGSFKVRGAIAKITAGASSSSVIAASTGNHGLAVAYACDLAGRSAQVFVPETISPAKLEKLRGSGASVELVGQDCVDAENAARRLADESGSPYVSPYNDIDVILGQGSIMLEMMKQIPNLARVYVAVGGGGLCSGISLAAEALSRKVEIVACSPINSCVMFDSLKAGRIVQDKGLPTLSDGTAGGIEEGSITLEICREGINRWMLISEEEIANATQWALSEHQLVVEGAAGVAIAAWKKDPETQIPSAIVVCGGEPA